MSLSKCEENNFIMAFSKVSFECHKTAVAKGWWDTPRNDGELIALIHSELSECLEALRHGNPTDDKIPQYNGATAELADAVIRIMDMARARRWDIAEAIVDKMAFNETRERKHGKEF